MGSEKAFSDDPNTLFRITVLVVDDDTTSLTIVSVMLRECRYEVTSVKNPIDALSIIRARPTSFDIVVTDIHMPEMNGIELQRQINREFQLPVIIMSSDDQESVMLESLQGGAVFFIAKPVNPDHLKNVWQHAIAARKGKSVMIEEIRSFPEGESSSSGGKRSKGVEIVPASMGDSNEHKVAKRETKRKVSPRKNKDDEEDEEGSAPKKTKIIWTSTLHKKFLDALRHIGMDKAVPKKILEFMGMPGLTRENVASHLQKYRMFLKRLAERDNLATRALAESILRSSFATSHPELLRAAKDYARWTELQQRWRASTYQPTMVGFGGTESAAVSSYNTASTHASILYSDQNASSSNVGFSQKFGYGQSRLLGSNRANNRRLLSANTNHLYRDNRIGFGNRSNLSLKGGLSTALTKPRNGCMNGANYSMRKYHQQIQARPSFNYDANSSSSPFNSCLTGLQYGNSTLSTRNMGTMGNFTLASYVQLSKMGQTHLLNNVSYGSMNASFNGNMYFTSMGDQTFGCKEQLGSSSAGSYGANQALLPAYSGEANTLVFPSLDNNNGEATSDNSVLLMNNASNLHNIASPKRSQQPGGVYLNDSTNQQSNYNPPSQEEQEGGQDVQNLDFLDNTLLPEIYPSLDDLLNIDFSEALSLKDLDDEQVPSGDVEQLMETGLNCRDGGSIAAPSHQSYPTDSNSQIIKQQQSQGNVFTDFELHSALQMNYNVSTTNDGAADDNQIDWEEDFLDSLLNFNPQIESISPSVKLNPTNTED